MSAAPLYLTRRDPAAASDGHAIGVMAAALGTPLMPWQQAVVDVATEHHPDRPGAWRYPVVVLTIPRQSGKTTLLRALMAQRALTSPTKFQAFLTAQTGKDARARWRDLADSLEASLGAAVKIKRGAGAESIEFTHNRSFISPFAPTPKSLHGYTPNLVCIDEAFAFDLAQGTDLLGAILPAQQTLPDRQLWIVSTAGDSRSAWLREWVDNGRAAVADPGAVLCYAEWGAGDRDPLDAEHWPEWHPALGITIEAQALHEAAANMPRGEFARAYGNQWTLAAETVIKPEDLTACIGHQDPAPPTEVALAYEVAADRSAAAIWAGWTTPEGRVCIRPYRQQAGTGWLIPALLEAQAAGFRGIWADDGGTTRAFTDAARLAGVTVETLAPRDLASATGDFIQAITEHELTRPGADGLDEAAAVAVTRLLSGAPVWDRTKSAGQIHALVAASVAHRAATHAPEPAGKPVIGVLS